MRTRTVTEVRSRQSKAAWAATAARAGEGWQDTVDVEEGNPGLRGAWRLSLSDGVRASVKHEDEVSPARKLYWLSRVSLCRVSARWKLDLALWHKAHNRLLQRHCHHPQAQSS